jgi:3'-phosphoadenosine 5'-phosphosulfate sulfotransferase (PAPS reductase)/FAD synthetase
MKHIVSFSGGKDSTAMLLMMIERKMPIDYIVYVDNGKEFPQMYDHIKKVEAYIKPFEITKLEYDFDFWFGERVITKGRREGEIGYGWPVFRIRWCTRLKIWTIKKFRRQFKYNTIEYIGLAYDEKDRAKESKPKKIMKYPLIDWEITEKQALQYCYDKGFDWDGLYEKIGRVSCYCCPLMHLEYLEVVYKDFPALWDTMKEMNKKSFRNFRYDYTLDELEERFDKQNSCFKENAHV